MTAQVDYFHIYNRGIEKRQIFADGEDYEVFLKYLKGYLSTPGNPESAKKEFSVNGRVYRGLPHQPKNYFDKIELTAFTLAPESFHLVVRELSGGSLESFIRSLCTRYSMYFNKKYQRTGSLFQGPYKSSRVKDQTSLNLLTRHLHLLNGISSYEEYLGKRETSWIKPRKTVADYKDYIEKYEPNSKDNALLDAVTFDGKTRIVQTSEPVKSVKTLSRLPEISAIMALFVLLVGIGIKNINANEGKNLALSHTSAPVVLSEADSVAPTPTPEPSESKTMVEIAISDGAESVNIRMEPTTASTKIGDAYQGDTFELVSVNSGWYEVKLPGGTTGFISARYTKLLEQTDN